MRSMSRRLVFGLIAALVSASAVLAASQPPDAVRAVVQAEIDEAMGPPEPDEPKRIRANTTAMFRRIDVNSDGVPDWRVDYEKAPNPSYFCGTGGCRQQILVSRPDGGYDLAFNLTVREFKLRRAKGQTLLDVDFHGSMCGGYGVDPCPRSYGWATAAGRFLERPGVDGTTFLVGGPALPVNAPRASLPAPVLAAYEAKVAACTAAGGSYPYNDAYVSDVADLNSDGVRDWIVGGAYDSCAFEDTAPDSPPAFPTTVFVSGPGGFHKALEDRLQAWGLDLAGPSATFVTLSGPDDCGLNGKDCVQTRWRWDGAALVSKAAEQP